MQAIMKNNSFVSLSQSMIYSIYYTYKMFRTVTKHCKDNVNNPPMLRLKDLLLLITKNSINFCICIL